MLYPHAGERQEKSNGDSESQWLARVLRTIGHVALIEPPNAVDGSANKDPADQALDATLALIRLLNDIEGDLRA
jgi:hypothetical protein